MRTDSQHNSRLRTLALALATAGMALFLLAPTLGCRLTEEEEPPTLSEAFSDLGDASENAWDEVADWFS